MLEPCTAVCVSDTRQWTYLPDRWPFQSFSDYLYSPIYVWLLLTPEQLRHRTRQVCWRCIEGWQGGDVKRNKWLSKLLLLLWLVPLDVEDTLLFYGSLRRGIFCSFCRQWPFEITWRRFGFYSQQPVRASASPDWLPDAKFITSEQTRSIP